MPIYEYRCRDCGHELEAMQRITAQPLTDCPDCGEAELTRLISATSFVLKGSGWYVTDYKDKGKGKGKAEGSSDGEAASDSGSTKAADTASAGTQTTPKKSGDAVSA